MLVMTLKLRLNFEAIDFDSYFLYALLPIVTHALQFGEDFLFDLIKNSQS